jgi:hypothetical protein
VSRYDFDPLARAQTYVQTKEREMQAVELCRSAQAARRERCRQVQPATPRATRPLGTSTWRRLRVACARLTAALF